MLVATRTIHGNLIWLSIHGAIVLCQVVQISKSSLTGFSNIKAMRYALRPIREECGLGCPPSQFTTNASESVNALLKRKVDYKKNELPDFLDRVKEIIQEQQMEG